MMTEHMRLQSTRDAAVWADQLGDIPDEGRARLAAWIWDNKPEIGCTYAEHPIRTITDDEFWAIVQAE